MSPTKMSPTSSIPRLFKLIQVRGASLIPILAEVQLNLCKSADVEHAARHRQYMHYGHFDKTICYARASEELELEWKVGLIAHELGHAAADLLGFWGKHSETDANRLGSAILGSMVRYRGPDRLEWAPVPRWLAEKIAWGRSRAPSVRGS